MITIHIPELHKLKRFKAKPTSPKFHPPTKQYGLKNEELPNMGGIYGILNKNEEIIYIGMTKNIQNRIATHLGNNLSNSAITNKEDIDTVVFVPEFELEYSIEGIERIYIDMYHPKYNDIPTKVEYGLTTEMQREALRNIPMR